MAQVVGRAIRKRRIECGYSQEALADRLNIHRTQVGFIERGENTTSIYTLAVIAKLLGSSASAILRETGF